MSLFKEMLISTASEIKGIPAFLFGTPSDWARYLGDIRAGLTDIKGIVVGLGGAFSFLGVSFYDNLSEPFLLLWKKWGIYSHDFWSYLAEFVRLDVSPDLAIFLTAAALFATALARGFIVTSQTAIGKSQTGVLLYVVGLVVGMRLFWSFVMSTDREALLAEQCQFSDWECRAEFMKQNLAFQMDGVSEFVFTIAMVCAMLLGLRPRVLASILGGIVLLMFLNWSLLEGGNFLDYLRTAV